SEPGPGSHRPRGRARGRRGGFARRPWGPASPSGRAPCSWSLLRGRDANRGERTDHFPRNSRKHKGARPDGSVLAIGTLTRPDPLPAGSLQPLTHTSGSSRATFRESPAASAASTTAETSL